MAPLLMSVVRDTRQINPQVLRSVLVNEHGYNVIEAQEAIQALVCDKLLRVNAYGMLEVNSG